jgi:hypothetical protein
MGLPPVKIPAVTGNWDAHEIIFATIAGAWIYTE